MKNEKNLTIAFTIYIAILVLISISRIFVLEDISNVLLVIIRIFVVLLFAVFFIVVFTIQYLIKKDNKEYEEKFTLKQYTEIKILAEKKSKKYLFARLVINSKYNLLRVLFLEGKRKEAFDLLNKTYWRAYEKKVIFYKILQAMHEGNWEAAEKMSSSLANNVERCEELLLIEAIMNYKQHHILSPQLDQCRYPIVKDICHDIEKK